MRMLMFGALMVALVGCRKKADDDKDTDPGGGDAVDADGDGWDENDDCDDNDASINPSAVEICNDVDDDCDGQTDEELGAIYYKDADEDSYGDPGDTRQACVQPEGYVSDSADCDDQSAANYPGAPEQCDSVDNDCDGDVDEEVISTIYVDADGDGHGDPLLPEDNCIIPDGYSALDDDCDDTRDDVNPDAAEVCNDLDDDCDEVVDEDDALDAATWWADVDEDGFGDAAATTAACDQPEGYADNADDCDDTLGDVNPDAEEICNDIDDNCDTVVDLVDADRDGYVAGECGGPDCDDGNIDVNPGATEVWYDGVDSDCDGGDDDDADGDGYTAVSVGGDDCDDDAATVNPGATDAWYDGVDADCAGDSDYDADADGHDWTVFGGDDCNDNDNSINPDATDVWYDGIDSDCAGDNDYDADLDGYLSDSYGGADCDDTDGSINPVATDAWYDGVDSDCAGNDDYDADVDGFASDGYGGTDCDDTLASVRPGASDTWYDGVDSDCAGDDDYDADADGFTSDAYGGTDCDDAFGTTYPGATDAWYDGIDADCAGDDDYDADVDGYQASFFGGTDCDDGAAAVNPGATEVWYDGVDADCAGDDDYDADMDGFASDAYTGADCDDTLATVYPGAADAWYDGVDSDCAGNSDYDFDGDGYDSALYGGTDCADLNVNRNPGATEVWYDGVDTDCDGLSDYDADADGYDSKAYGGTDCWDAEAGMNPGGTEVADDGLDNDCDGIALRGTVSGGASVAFADATLTGEATLDRLSQGDPGFAWAGDLDGDGVDDLVVGAILHDAAGSNAGAAYVVAGPVSGTQDVGVAAMAKLTGEAAGDYAGRGVSGLGDVNDDGYDDLGVNSLNEDTGGTDAGAVYVLFGPVTGDASLSTADAKFTGDAAADIFADFTFAGDMDGDGFADMIVGAQGWDGGGTGSGGAFLFYGPMSVDGGASSAGVRLVGEGAGDGAGSSIGGGGDVDGDGFTDILVGALNDDTGGVDAGAVYLIHGPVTTTTDLSQADAKMTGEEEDAQVGSAVSVANAGDTDGDGYDDIVIGAQYDNDVAELAGAAYIVLGPVSSGTFSLATADAKLLGVAERDRTGDSVDGLGDVDGDGNSDVIIGSGYSDYSSAEGGMVYVVTGPFSGTSSLQTAYFSTWATGDGDRARGYGVGDLDNDGLQDIGLGAMLNDDASANAGALYLFMAGSM